MRALAIVVILCLFVASAARASCGNAVPSAALQGTFHKISLDDKCASADNVGFSLTTGLMDEAPLFTIRATMNGECVWSLASISKDRVIPIAQVKEDLWGLMPAAGSDGSYWLAAVDHYIKLIPASSAIDVPAYTKDYAPVAIGSTSTGRLFAIERGHSKSLETPLRLINIATGKSVPTPIAGWAENLLRASDGNLYFRLFERWHCHVFEVVDDGILADTVPCPWENGHTIAVDKDGGIWQPTLLGVAKYDSAGKVMQSVAPVAPEPCTISNTAVLTPHLIVADGRGTVWFVLGKLWRLDEHGLSHIDLPFASWVVAAMVETADGALWIAATDYNGHGALYRFIPHHPR